MQIPEAAQQSRRLLNVAALLGRDCRIDLLCRISSVAPRDILRDLTAAMVQGLVELIEPDLLRFSHDLVRRAVAADIPPAERQRLHGMCGEALERFLQEGRRVESATLAHHYSLAGPDQRAVP